MRCLVVHSAFASFHYYHFATCLIHHALPFYLTTITITIYQFLYSSIYPPITVLTLQTCTHQHCSYNCFNPQQTLRHYIIVTMYHDITSPLILGTFTSMAITNYLLHHLTCITTIMIIDIDVTMYMPNVHCSD
jgi:hypothetical protein